MSKSKSITLKTAGLYWNHAWRYKRYVVGILIILPIAVLTEQFLNTMVLASILDRLSSGNFDPNNLVGSFGLSVVTYTALMVVGGTIGWRVIDIFNWKLEGNVQTDLAHRVYSHLLNQSANFHANRFSGSLVSQTSKFLGGYIRIADTTIYQVYQLFISLIFSIIILAPRAPIFAAVLLLFAIVYMISGLFVTRKVRKLTGVHAASESRQTGYLADSITNIMAIKSFSGAHFENKSFGKYTDRTREDLLSIMRANNRQMLTFSLMNRFILVCSLILAILGVAVFNANIATVFLIFSFTGNLINQLWVFCNNSLRTYSRAFGDAQDMVKILSIEPGIKDPYQAEKLRISRGAIKFNEVTFTHDGMGQSLFEGFSLAIKAGEKVGLVGHSGSGKTTFTRLLLRFSDIDNGEILIDGQNIAHIKQDDLHRKIAYVPQEPIMFHRTLRDNIRYGNFNASDKEVEAATKNSHASEFINELPEGYDTLVGERGVKLSGGQRQRIAIARAMIKDAPILLLDEATSALDSESEVLIQDALWKLMKGRTTIVIAHRLSTIQKMDRIIVLDDGKIVEEGSHKELLRKNGVYANLWEHQSGGFLED